MGSKKLDCLTASSMIVPPGIRNRSSPPRPLHSHAVQEPVPWPRLKWSSGQRCGPAQSPRRGPLDIDRSRPWWTAELSCARMCCGVAKASVKAKIKWADTTNLALDIIVISPYLDCHTPIHAVLRCGLFHSDRIHDFHCATSTLSEFSAVSRFVRVKFRPLSGRQNTICR